VVLFINKSDLIPGSPRQAEEQAKALYAPLIDSLRQYATQIDVKVLVGSASYGHSTHVLFSHFVEQILPNSAYDAQLLQRMKVQFRERMPTITPGMAPPSQSQPHFPAPQIPHALPPSNGQAPMPQHFAPASQPQQRAPQQQAPVAPGYPQQSGGVRPGFGTRQMPRLPDNPMEATAPLLNRQAPPMPRKG